MSPKAKPLQFAAALNSSDLDAMLAYLRTRRAFHHARRRRSARNREIRLAIQQILEFLLRMEMPVLSCFVAGEIALVIGKWTLETTPPDSKTIALHVRNTDVRRQSADGEWRCVIDNPNGTA